MINVLLLLSRHQTLRDWHRIGQLSRELDIYNMLGLKCGGLVYILTYGGSSERKYLSNHDNIKVISKPRFIPSTDIFPKKIARYFDPLYEKYLLWGNIFQKRNISLVKTNQFSSSLFGLKINKTLIVRMGFYYTHDPDTFYDRNVYYKLKHSERSVFRKAKGIIVTTEEAKKFICSEYNIDINKIIHIPNYINTSVFRNHTLDRAIDVLYIGRLNARKNVPLLLEALEGLNVKIKLIGTGTKAEKNECIKLIQLHKLDADLSESTNNFELPKWYSRSKIFILPSKFEGNPKVLLEAMSCETACIGADVTGINNIINHNKNGLLFKSNDVNSLKNRIVFLLENEDVRHRIGKAARQYILKNNDIKTRIKEEVAFFTRILTT